MMTSKDALCRSEVDPLKPLPAKGHRVIYDTKSHYKARICKPADVNQHKKKWWNDIKKLVETTAKSKKSIVVVQDFIIKDEYFCTDKGTLKKRSLVPSAQEEKAKEIAPVNNTKQQKPSQPPAEVTSLIWSRRDCHEKSDGSVHRHTHYIEKRFSDDDSLSQIIENAFLPLDSIKGESFIIKKQRLTCKTKGLVIHLDDVINQGLWIQILTNYKESQSSSKTAGSFAEKLGLSENDRWKGTYLSYMKALKRLVADEMENREAAEETRNDDTTSESEISEQEELNSTSEEQEEEESEQRKKQITNKDKKDNLQNTPKNGLGAKDSSKETVNLNKYTGEKSTAINKKNGERENNKKEEQERSSIQRRDRDIERLKKEAIENGFTLVPNSNKPSSKSNVNYKK